jgi:hypothetical protein
MQVTSPENHRLDNIVLSVLTFIIYLLALFPLTRGAAGYLYVFSLALLGILPVLIRDFRTKSFVLLLVVLISALLLLLGTNPGFFSPFFFVLFLVSLAAVFLLNPSISFALAVVTVAGLLSQIEPMSSRLGAVSIFAMFLIVPFSYFLSRTSLWLAERDKKIVILEKQQCAHFHNSVDELLNNQLTRFFAQVREPLSDIKQIAYYTPETGSQEAVEKNRTRIISASEYALGMIKDFEQETTGRKLLTTPR